MTSLINSYFDIKFEVIKKAESSSHSTGNDIKLTDLGPIALFSIYKLTNSSGKQLEEISNTYKVSLTWKFLNSAKNTDDLSIVTERGNKVS